ncbi:hypothetical protein [Spirosoma fluminis]
MKNLLLVLLFLPLCATAQQTAKKSIEAEKELSNAERFSEKSGTLIKREYEDVGTLKKCKIQIATFTDIISGQKTKALRFEYEAYTSLGADTKLALLDADEIDGLIKSINYLQTDLLQSKPANYTEGYYRSRGGFECGCFSGDKGWSAFMKLERFDSKSYVFIKPEDLTELLALLAAAKVKLT